MASETAATSPQPPLDWPTLGRIVLKALLLFALLNAAFAAVRPLESLGRLSLYNAPFPGRARLPYGERPADDYNLTLNNLPAMFAAHELARPKAADEFRVLLMGDSGTWGWFLANHDTLAGQLNARGLRAADGRRIVVYNLGYPVLSLTKDLLLLDTALSYDPDLVLWPVTLHSFARGRQLDHPLLQQNAGRVRDLIARYDLALDPFDSRLVVRTRLDETLVARRRDLADLLRLQALALAWAATGIDQAIPADIPPRQSDLDDDESWLDVAAPRLLTDNDVTFDVLRAGVARAGNIPVVIINEPIFISNGANSAVRYNAFYPRWAYDQYRDLLARTAAAEGWRYVDLWDAIPPDEFTDTPVHLTPAGSRLLADLLVEEAGTTEYADFTDGQYYSTLDSCSPAAGTQPATVVPAPGTEWNSNAPPDISSRVAIDFRPKLPACCAAWRVSGDDPRPSSQTANRTRPFSRVSVTDAALASAWATVLSSAC